MTNIWPLSPVPADLGRMPRWNSGLNKFDSGVNQGYSFWFRPLYSYQISMRNIPQSKMNSLEALFNACKGPAVPFMFKDPYQFAVGSVLLANTGTNVRTAAFFTTDSWQVIPERFQIVSALSGTLTSGSHYTFNQDTGIVTFSLAPSSADYFGVRSMEYYRKCRFSDKLDFRSSIWQIWNGSVEFVEEIP